MSDLWPIDGLRLAIALTAFVLGMLVSHLVELYGLEWKFNRFLHCLRPGHCPIDIDTETVGGEACVIHECSCGRSFYCE